MGLRLRKGQQLGLEKERGRAGEGLGPGKVLPQPPRCWQGQGRPSQGKGVLQLQCQPGQRDEN